MSESQSKGHERRFFSSGRDVETVLETAHKICLDGARIYGMVLTADGDFSKHVRGLTKGWARLRGFTVSENFPYLVEAPRRNLDGTKVGNAKAIMWQEPDSPLCYFMSCQPREDFEFLFNSAHAFLTPDVCRLFLRTPQIESSLTTVAKLHPKLDIRVRQYVARKWMEERTHGGQVDTTVQYTNEAYASVFRDLEKNEMWLDSLQVDTHGSHFCTGRISRDSMFSCTSNFRFFFHEFVGTFARTMLTFRKIFQNRGRLNSPTHASKPLKIVYKSAIFADKRNNHRLIRVLEQCPNSALSVIHPNPYLHASLIDYSDGSSYSILVSTTTGILITPERKASAQSLARLCEFICDHFEEGDVVEFIPHDS